MKLPWRARSLQWLINASLVMFGALLALALTLQGFLSQGLIEHPLWQQMLESSTQTILRLKEKDIRAALPTSGAIKGWLIEEQADVLDDMPPVFAPLRPGYYSENQIEELTSSSSSAGSSSILTPRWGPFADAPGSKLRDRSYSVLVSAVPQGRLIMAIDMTELEDDQNGSVQLSFLFLLFTIVMIGLVSWRLHLSLTQPINDLANRMRELNPLQPSERLPTTYKKSELNTIASETNAHLERVELAIERERSLLDQASHEFRTPVAVISGAADVLHKLHLDEKALRPLHRIDEAVENLTQIMEALLYLSREPSPKDRAEATDLHDILQRLVDDHKYLLTGKPVQLILDIKNPLIVNAPESMARIAVGNLLRNAAEHTYEGEVHVVLRRGALSINDSGSGFDTAQAAQRYSASLKRGDRQPSGAGLGLFLTQRICERFGWRLSLHSSESAGTSAVIHFPTD